MTTKLNFLKKFSAIALATIFLSLPFANIAAAAPKHEGRPPRQEQRVERRDHKDHHRADKHQAKRPKHHKQKVIVHRPAPRHHHKDNSGKVVGGLILGAVLGAVIANNT